MLRRERKKEVHEARCFKNVSPSAYHVQSLYFILTTTSPLLVRSTPCDTQYSTPLNIFLAGLNPPHFRHHLFDVLLRWLLALLSLESSLALIWQKLPICIYPSPGDLPKLPCLVSELRGRGDLRCEKNTGIWVLGSMLEFGRSECFENGFSCCCCCWADAAWFCSVGRDAVLMTLKQSLIDFGYSCSF
jgi:hypothetical protein